MSGFEIVVCVIAMAIGVAVKAVTGMGFPLVAIPVISLFATVEDAAIVVALPNTLMNLVLAWRVRFEAPLTRDLPTLAVAGVIGAFFGTQLLLTVDEFWLLLALAGTVVAYVAYAVLRPEGSLSPELTRIGAVPVGLFAGVMQGAVGICGPPVAAWLHAYRLTAGAFVFAVSVVFFVASAAQLAALAVEGRVVGPRLWIGVAAIPLVLAAVPLGERLRARFDQRRFEKIVLWVLALSAVSLVVRAVR